MAPVYGLAMNIFGDLERFFVDVIWPIRVPLAIAFVVGMALFVYVAWRRGWIASARAHPRPVVVGLVLLIAVLGPLGWILGSPLILRSELVEEVPQAVAASTESAATTLTSGEWQGADDFHFGSGSARIVEAADGSLTLTLEDFSVQNGPDLFVYVSPDPAGWTEEAVNLGGLKATDGTFSYEIPPGVSADDIASAIVWCKAFSVLFAAAPLEPATA
jgi:hypothetical protein